MKNFFSNLVALLLAINVFAQDTLLNPRTDLKLLHNFESRKLGLFVHWMACHTPETGDSWSIGNGTSKHVADSISLAWDPEKFSAKEIVDFAVKAGCGYMVVIAKHHDGFGIWNSQYSDWDIKRSKFKKDILKELGDSCRSHGLLFGIYYSIADLHYTGWERMPEAGQPPPEPKKGKKDFVAFCHNQVKELIDRYHPDILWFDGFWLGNIWGMKEGRDLYAYIKSIKPNILATRLSSSKNAMGKGTFLTDGSSGDFYSYEAKTTDAPVFPWEACTSVSYPVYAYEPKAKLLSKAELINMFDKVICGNGNFLLNIGPERTGEMPEKLIDRFLDLSGWIQANKTAVYNTKGGPFKQGKWGGSTYKGNNIYLHLRDSSTTIKIDKLAGYKIKAAKDLVTGKPLKFVKEGKSYQIKLPKQENAEIRVVELKLDKPYHFSGWIDL
ncbi:MAG: alpha-L-fucosidase [Bacteroidetes bacterium]|nr:alpha-L-fucosidase [Bacteroidota bacterium]